MSISSSQKQLIVILMAFACIFSSGAEAWSWRWKWDSRPGWRWSSGSSKHNETNHESPREIVVGGSDGWRYGYDLREWASKNAPFYVHDVLVFKYDNLTSRRHDVYLLPNLWSYMSCNIQSGKKIASTKEENESKDSFKFTLAISKPYFFACGEHNGDYCSDDHKKFSVIPVSRQSN